MQATKLVTGGVAVHNSNPNLNTTPKPNIIGSPVR